MKRSCSVRPFRRSGLAWRLTCALALAVTGCTTPPPDDDAPAAAAEVVPAPPLDPVPTGIDPTPPGDEPIAPRGDAGPAPAPGPLDQVTIDHAGDDRRIAETFARLTDPAMPAADRRGAALVLLQIEDPAAGEALHQALTDATELGAVRAVVQAVLLSAAEPPASLGPPLIEQLSRTDGPLQQEVAEALGRVGDAQLEQQLIARARREGGALEDRMAAIRALGYQRTKAVVEALMGLIEDSRPLPVQEEAYAALATLTGLEGFEQDRASWQQWWRQARRYDPERWSAMLMENLARRESARRMRQAEVERRLIESQRALYRATLPEDRPAVLTGLLSDTLTPLRLLGMELALERQLAGLPFDEPLREALRQRLTDTTAALRQQAALRLADLADSPSAAIVAARLARGQEHVSSVLRAYLVLMARLPQVTAVEPALALLGRPSVQAEAASALAAMAQLDLLSPPQRRRAAATARQAIRRSDSPSPSFVTLLGRVGSEEDWQQIADWIDADDPAVRQAAATAWAQSSRSLKLLADRVADPVIQLIVIDAATRRGADPFTLKALAQSPPQRPQVIDAWRRALVAMAARVPPADLLETVATLRERPGNHTSELIEQMLAAALDPAADRALTFADRSTLRLARAQSLLQHGGHLAALEDLRIADTLRPAMDSSQQQQLDHLLLEAHLAAEQFDDAIAALVRLLPTPTDSAATDPLIVRVLDYAQSQIDRQRPEPARQLLTRLQAALAARLGTDATQRLTTLLQRAQPAPAPDPTP